MPSAKRGNYFDGPKGRADRSFVIFVEGNDDAIFIDTLLYDLGANADQVGVVWTEGKDNLKRDLNLLAKSASFVSGTIRRALLIQDADDDPSRTLLNVRSTMQELGLPTPKHGAWARSETDVSFGLFLIPSAERAGELETLCMSLVSNEAKARNVIEFYSKMEQDYGLLRKRDKRICLIYLACCDTEARGAGMATAGGFFNIGHPNLSPLRDFLRETLSML